MLSALRWRARQVAKDVIGPRILGRLPRRADLPWATFGLSADDGRLRLRGHALTDLVAAHGSPLHVVDGDRLGRHAADALAPLRDPTRPGCDVFYSYKTNPVPAVLRRLHDAGIGAEVISEYELWLALELGVPGHRIIYNGPAKSAASIRTAIEQGVLVVNANSIGDVDRIAAVAAESGSRAPIGLRVALSGAWGGQFGLPADPDAVAAVVARCRDDDHLDLIGFHVHRGGTIRSADDFAGHIEQIAWFLGELHDRTGWAPRLIDAGGSLASPTVAGFPQREFRLNRAIGSDLLPPDPASAITVAQASELAAARLAAWAGERGIDVPDVVLEPGRALTSDSQFLLTSVIDVKTDVEPHHAVLDAGINIAEAAANEYHQLYHAGRPTESAVRSYRLAGPICTPADVLYNNWRLPELATGDLLAIMDAGAYFVPFSTSFSFPRPAIVVADGDTISVGRRREEFADIVALDPDDER